MVHPFVRWCSFALCRSNVFLVLVGNEEPYIHLSLRPIWKWESGFTLSLNAAKNSNYIEKYFKPKLSKIKLCTKTQRMRITISPRSGDRGRQTFAIFEILFTGVGMANLWRSLAPLLGEIEICLHWVFCRKFNLKQLLFAAFFYIIGTFCSVPPRSDCTFPFQCILSKMANFWCPMALLLEEMKTYTQ